MRQWRKFTNPPMMGELILVPVWVPGNPELDLPLEEGLRQWNHLRIMYYSPEAVEEIGGSRWQSAEGVIDAAVGYDPKFGDERLCLCGHPYYRHFDTYVNMYPIGCKYCHGYEEGISHRKELRPPDGIDDAGWDKWYKENHPPPSICEGFKLDVSTEPPRVVENLWGDLNYLFEV